MSDTPTYNNRKRHYTFVDRVRAITPQFQSRVSIARKTVTRDDFNDEIIVFVPQQDLQDIPAYIEPALTAGEQRQPDQTIVVNRWQIALQGYYPTIIVSDQAIVNGVEHNVLNVVHDDSKTLTMLFTEIINPDNESAIPQ